MKVLVFGDSLVQNLDFEDSLEYEYHVESYHGFLARDLTELLTISLKEEKYDFVILCCGINDIGHGYSDNDVVSSLLLLHNVVRNYNSIVVAVYLHSEYNLFNELYSQKSLDDVCFCEFFYNLHQNDLEDDGFHLSLEGKEHFVDALQDCIENIHL
jgi:lysophospholipase L1-like esterase